MNPVVSCIIPTYNRVERLVRAIESVREQTFSNWELIVVDDRSSDTTPQYVQNLSMADSRIVYTKNIRRQGPAGARNHGVLQAKGAYVAFLDSDDEWKEWHLEKCIASLRENQAVDWLFCDMERYVNGDLINSSYFLEVSPYFLKIPITRFTDVCVFSSDDIMSEILSCSIPAYVQSSVIKRVLLAKMLFNEDLFGVEDSYLVLSWVAAGNSIGYSKRVDVSYHIHDNNISNSNNRVGDAKKNVDRGLEMEKLWRAVSHNLSLAKNHQSKIRIKKAENYIWAIGYNGFARQRMMLKAIVYYLKAIALRPTSLTYWKSLAVLLIKALLGVGKAKRSSSKLSAAN